MKSLSRFFLTTSIFLGTITGLSADDCFSNCFCGSVLNIEVDCGWRQDRMDFGLNLELDGDIPDNTTIKINAIDSIQTGARILWTIPCGVYVRARGDYGHVYNASEKTNTTSAIFSPFGFSPKLKDGCVYDLLGGIGYQFHVLCDQLIVAPVVGWSGNLINLNMHKGKLHGVFPNGSTDAELTEHHINGRAQGPWIGLDFIFCPTPCMNAFATVEYHWDDYHQKQTDELVATIDTLDLLYNQTGKVNQKANCNAFETTLGIDYAFWDCLSVGVVGHYKYMSGKFRNSTRYQGSIITDSAGDVIAPFTEVEIPTKKAKIHWQTADVEVALIYYF